MNGHVYVQGVSIVHLSTIFLLDFGTVLTVRYLLLFILLPLRYDHMKISRYILNLNLNLNFGV